MCLAALVDAGVPLAYLQEQLSALGLDDEFTLSVAPTHHHGLRALQAQVTLTGGAEASAMESASQARSVEGHDPGHSHDHGHHHGEAHHSPQASAADGQPTRNLPAIEQLITRANLPERACRWSLAVFRRLAEAEAAVHGIALEQVHFHEVGATDAIVDIVGTCLGLDYLGIDQLVCSPLPTGRGRVRAAHGWLPVPAPAVLKLFEQRQVPIYSNGLDGELVTPTGAAIATALADHFGDPPAMTLHRTGLGAGGKILPVPNLLRLWVGAAIAAPTPALPLPLSLSPAPKPEPAPPSYPRDTVVLLASQIDDMVPQVMGYLYERLYAAGALEVFTQPIAMKKSRPGLLLTVLCRPSDELSCADILFAETPTLGIRRQTQQRWFLPRRIEPLSTPYGTVAVKVAHHPHTQALLNIHPEYEDCATLARRHGVPWQTIYHSALHAWYSHHPADGPSALE